MKFYEEKHGQTYVTLYCNDVLDPSVPIEVDSIDLVVTLPPYNIEVAYSSGWDDGVSYDAYLAFTRAWLERVFYWLKPDGRICLNIPLDKNRNTRQSVYADFVQIAKQVGFKYQSTIVWNEGNISRRTAWGSWMSASAPNVIAPVEMILVLYKHSWRKLSKGKSDITRDEFIAWTNGLWTFNGENRFRVGHPAPFPVELPRRCIKMFSYVGDVVLDPFCGSGTTLLACIETGRIGIGIEICKEYCTLSVERIHKTFSSTEVAHEKQEATVG